MKKLHMKAHWQNLNDQLYTRIDGVELFLKEYSVAAIQRNNIYRSYRWGTSICKSHYSNPESAMISIDKKFPIKF